MNQMRRIMNQRRRKKKKEKEKKGTKEKKERGKEEEKKEKEKKAHSRIFALPKGDRLCIRAGVRDMIVGRIQS